MLLGNAIRHGRWSGADWAFISKSSKVKIRQSTCLSRGGLSGAFKIKIWDLVIKPILDECRTPGSQLSIS